ncbi:MAG TPA: hypothetical protein VHS58_20895 [Acetobacteraceae bacterium]|nr:hypothetical protein [Acetobacteraceae bacterium]
MNSYQGSCHCGAIRVTLRSRKTAAELGARSCQCSFCRSHGASWTSDPAGALDVVIAGNVSRYRLGTGTAEFLVCTVCGVVPAVTWESEGRLLSVVRVDCLRERDELLAHATDADFDGEVLAQRLARRSRNWTPVTVRTEGASSSEADEAPPFRMAN